MTKKWLKYGWVKGKWTQWLHMVTRGPKDKKAKHRAQASMSCSSCQQPSETGIAMLIWQMSKLRLRHVKCYFQSTAAYRWQHWDSHPGPSNASAWILSTLPCTLCPFSSFTFQIINLQDLNKGFTYLIYLGFSSLSFSINTMPKDAARRGGSCL